MSVLPAGTGTNRLHGRITRQGESAPSWLSTPFHKYDHVCCVAFRFWLSATREHPPSRPVGMTEEQQRQNRKATQPCGRRFFSALPRRRFLRLTDPCRVCA